MKPLNSKERNKVYWQVLIIYVITTALIVLIVSSAFVPPGALDEVQQKHLHDAESFSIHQQEILNSIDSISTSIATIGTSSDATKYNTLAADLTLDFRKLPHGDSALINLLTRIADNFDAYRESMNNSNRLKRDKEELNKTIDALKIQINTIQAGGNLTR